MQRRRTTSRTSWRATTSTALRGSVALALVVALAAVAAPPTRTPETLAEALQLHRDGLARLGAHDPTTLETAGTLVGDMLDGRFHSWHDGEDDRFDQILGPRVERTIRRGDREWVVNASGDVRELVGSLTQRQRTQDFISSGSFADQPQYCTFVGPSKLKDGRAVVDVRVAPPGGDEETVSLDAVTGLVDMIGYVEGDGISTITYDDYRVVRGALVPYVEVDSNGDVAYDFRLDVKSVSVDGAIAPEIFAVPPSATVSNTAPVTVKLIERGGHYYAPVQLHGHDYTFLVDTGSQAVVVDASIATANTLIPEGTLEVAGAKRVGAVGVAPLESITVGGATVPVGLVSVVDLGDSTGGAFPIDGVLGYPFFAAAEVKIDFNRMTMTFGKPGTLPPDGAKIDLDTDRQLPEMAAKINGVATDVLIDTGDSVEMLVFNPFVRAHPGAVPYVGSAQVRNYGVGGSMSAVGTVVDQLDLGPYHMYHRRANLMLSSSGAFADRIDGGNVGLGTLRNFVVTFDLANRAMYLQRASDFDDGRYRTQYDH